MGYKHAPADLDAVKASLAMPKYLLKITPHVDGVPVVVRRGSRPDGRTIEPTRQQVLTHLYQRIIDPLPHTPYVSPRTEILPEHTHDVFQDLPTLSRWMATKLGVETACSTRDDGP